MKTIFFMVFVLSVASTAFCYDDDVLMRPIQREVSKSPTAEDYWKERERASAAKEMQDDLDDQQRQMRDMIHIQKETRDAIEENNQLLINRREHR